MYILCVYMCVSSEGTLLHTSVSEPVYIIPWGFTSRGISASNVGISSLPPADGVVVIVSTAAVSVTPVGIAGGCRNGGDSSSVARVCLMSAVYVRALDGSTS